MNIDFNPDEVLIPEWRRKVTLSLEDYPLMRYDAVIHDARRSENPGKGYQIAYSLTLTQYAYSNRRELTAGEMLDHLLNTSALQKGCKNHWLKLFGGELDVVVTDSPAHIVALTRFFHREQVPHRILWQSEVFERYELDKARMGASNGKR